MSESSRYTALYNIIMWLIAFVPTMCLSTVACFAIVYGKEWAAVAVLAVSLFAIPKTSISADKGKPDE